LLHPTLIGGIIPHQDEEVLLKKGVAKVFTPKDYEMNPIMEDIADIVLKNS